jgi:hypothetical protein
MAKKKKSPSKKASARSARPRKSAAKASPRAKSAARPESSAGSGVVYADVLRELRARLVSRI